MGLCYVLGKIGVGTIEICYLFYGKDWVFGFFSLKNVGMAKANWG